MVTMCRYKFIDCKHCTLVGDIDNWVNYVGVGESPDLLHNFAVNLKLP